MTGHLTRTISQGRALGLQTTPLYIWRSSSFGVTSQTCATAWVSGTAWRHSSVVSFPIAPFNPFLWPRMTAAASQPLHLLKANRRMPIRPLLPLRSYHYTNEILREGGLVGTACQLRSTCHPGVSTGLLMGVIMGVTMGVVMGAIMGVPMEVPMGACMGASMSSNPGPTVALASALPSWSTCGTWPKNMIIYRLIPFRPRRNTSRMRAGGMCLPRLERNQVSLLCST